MDMGAGRGLDVGVGHACRYWTWVLHMGIERGYWTWVFGIGNDGYCILVLGIGIRITV